MFSTTLSLILYDLSDRQKKRLNPAYPALKNASQGAHKMTELNRTSHYKLNLYPSTAISLQREIKSKKARDAGLTPPNAPK
jgi:hypothetical protein